MGISDRIRRAERAAKSDMVVIPQTDGTTKRFLQRALFEAVHRGWQRSRAHNADDEDLVPPPHPFTLALMGASPEGLAALLAKEGAGWDHLIAEEQVLRGEQERPGRAC